MSEVEQIAAEDRQVFLAFLEPYLGGPLDPTGVVLLDIALKSAVRAERARYRAAVDTALEFVREGRWDEDELAGVFAGLKGQK